MDWFVQALQKLKLVPTFTHDDVLNAENENDLYDHTKALEDVQTVCNERAVTNKKLRIVLLASRLRSNQFEELERGIKQETARIRG